jgi:FAD/FMN-containing dehydrogenase/Fe-S oxidoreductase
MKELADRLKREIEGEVMFDAFSRGRYSTDASIYQIRPAGVVVPKRFSDVEATLALAREQEVPITGRGGGTGQCGQTINRGLVIDFSKHLNGIRELDVENRRAVVEPGLVLDELNRQLKPHGMWFPVDVSTASRATIGGMTANNSCGSRSLRYGMMREHVRSIDALLADGTRATFGPVDRADALKNEQTAVQRLFRDMLALGAREAEEIAARWPRTYRNVAGYNIDAMAPNGPANNMATLLVGSEGTLALSESIEIALSPTLDTKALGICHFPTFREAMEAVQHIVKLDPVAVELVDENMIRLARDIAIFRDTVNQFVKGEPEALLLVEFAEPDPAENKRRLTALHELVADLGYRWGDPGKKDGGVIDAPDPAFQAQIWNVRTQGLNIMMSMKDDAKPLAFIEDCAVHLPDLPDFTARLNEVFAKNGTSATWYAHASVGLLHVRPVLNLKQEKGVKALRAIAEEAFETVAEYKGSHSGEHGDGIIRSEFHEKMLGSRLVRSFEEVKARFDPDGVLNPNRIVQAPKMDDRSLMRYPPDYAHVPRETVFDWGAWPAGLHGAVEMCNNNGACRKLAGGAMCPSYRATRNERDLTRGRANTLRLALTGQLGPDAFTSDEMMETMKLCVSCKACKRECPMSVDMAKMKIEVLAARAEKYGVSLRDRLVAEMPRYAPWLSKAPFLANARDSLPGAAWLSEKLLGLSAKRRLPRWRSDVFREPKGAADADVLFFADTFNRHFEPENARAAVDVLRAADVRLGFPEAQGRPLCCGRTYLSAGMTDRAKAEMQRSADAVRPVIERGGAVVGLEPSCVLTFRDEAPRLIDGWTEEMGRRVMLFEEFLADHFAAGGKVPDFGPIGETALLHGHCHQKAADVMGPVQQVLANVPGLKVKPIESSCCGMAGAFGYQAETYDVSQQMGELSLLPAVRAASEDAFIVADGTSCRHQIGDGTGREAVHVARILRHALEAGGTASHGNA